MEPFLALITPVGTGASVPPVSPGYPAHPIFLPGHPEHPIVLPPDQGGGGGGQPPGIWGGANEPFPTPPIANVPGAPGYRPPSAGAPSHPIWWPTYPSHPIVIPPMPPDPGGGGPGDGGPGDGKPPDFAGRPEHPINLPPTQAPDGMRWVLAYHPAIGWGWVLVPATPVPPTLPPGGSFPGDPGYKPPSGGNIPQPIEDAGSKSKK